MNQTWSQNSLTWGLHVMGLYRLMQIMLWFLTKSQYSVYFPVDFVSQTMSLKYMLGVHLPICYFSIIYIYQNNTYTSVGKTLYIVAFSIIYTYDDDKMEKSILKVPWLHTPASYFSGFIDDTMGKIAEQKLAMTDSFRIFFGNTGQTQYQRNSQ